MFPNDAGTAHTGVRPCRLPAASPTAISRLGCRTGNGPRTSPGIRAGDGKGVPLAAGRLPRWQDRRVHGRFRSRRRARRQDARQGRGDAAQGREAPGAFRPRMPLPVARMAGAHGPLRPGAVDGRQRPFPGRRRRGGVPRTHEDGARLSRALGGAYPRRGARPNRRLHPLVRPRAHQTAARLDESCTNTVKAGEWLRDHLQENVRSPLHNKTTHAKTNEAQLLIADWFCGKSIFSLSFSTEEKATVYLVNPSFS